MKINEEHFYFTSNNHELYGMLYDPVKINQHSENYLILHPFAEEKKSSQKVLVDLARSLCENGNCVLLFDFYGCGDSEGELSDAGFSIWLEDIKQASYFLREKTNINDVNIIGLRLGAFLSCVYATDNDEINKLILLEPVINPVKDLLRSLRSKLMKELCTDGEITSNRKDLLTNLNNNISVDFSGHEISSKFYKDLLNYSELNSYRALKRGKDTLLINISQIGKPTRQFQKLLSDIGTDITIQNKLINLEPFWGLIDLPDCMELVNEVVSWCRYHSNQSSVTGNRPKNVKLKTDYEYSTNYNCLLKERVITLNIDGNELFGILSEPDTISSNGITIIFLHGWAGYRIGPHRIFVDYARRFSDLGFYCLRYDFRGKGFSNIDDGTTNKSMLADVDCILEYIYKTNLPKKIILVGICSGAKLALYYAMKGHNAVENIIELSTTVLRPNNQIQIELSRTKTTIREYLTKAGKQETWNKFIKGELRFRLILKIISGPIIDSFKAFFGKKRISNRSNHNARKYKDAFLNFNGEILAIHGEKDPETEVALKQLTNLTSKYSIPFEKHIIKGANHSFYSIAWKNEIFDIIQYWLEKKYPVRVNSEK